jgi:hypothetical protein
VARINGDWTGGDLSLFVDLFCFSLFNLLRSVDCPLSQGTMGSRWELRHLAGSPGGGRDVYRLCHTLIRVNTV